MTATWRPPGPAAGVLGRARQQQQRAAERQLRRAAASGKAAAQRRPRRRQQRAASGGAAGALWLGCRPCAPCPHLNACWPSPPAYMLACTSLRNSAPSFLRGLMPEEAKPVSLPAALFAVLDNIMLRPWPLHPWPLQGGDRVRGGAGGCAAAQPQVASGRVPHPSKPVVSPARAAGADARISFCPPTSSPDMPLYPLSALHTLIADPRKMMTGTRGV